MGLLGELELETIVAGSSDGILLGSSLSQSESESEMRDRIICVNPLGGGPGGGAGGMYSSRYLMVSIEILITFSSS